MIQQGYDVNQDEQYLTEEQKRRRREALSGLVGGESISDVTSNYLGSVGADTTNRFNQVQQTFENPLIAAQQRLGINQGPMGPVMPTDVAQERQRQLETGPVMPQNIAEQRAMMTPENQQVQQYEPPVPGPGVQVAGPTQVPPQPTQQPQQTWMDELAKAGNDPTALAKFMSTTDNPEAKQAAGRMIAQQFNQQSKQQEAEQFANKAVQSGDLLPLMKRIQQEKGEGSYLKAYLYSRLGLNELAKDEQQKLGAGTTYQVAYDQNGNKALMEVTAQGLPVKGYNEKLQELTPEEFGKFAVGAAPKQAFLTPQVHGTPVTRTNPQTGQVENGFMIYDPVTRSGYVQVGNQRKDMAGWTTMAQTPQYVYGAAQAGALGKGAGEGFTPQPMKPFPGGAGMVPEATPQAVPQATVQGVPSGQVQARPIQQPQPIAQPQVGAGMPTVTQGGAITGLPAGTAGGGVGGGGIAQQKANLALQEARVKEGIQVAGQRSQAFNKILDEEVRPEAQKGDVISNTRKQQFAIFDRPGVDMSKIFGIATGAGQSPGDQRWTMFRDILLGKVSESDDRIRERAAALGLNRDEQNALVEYNNLNTTVNAQTLKSTAGPGSVSDAEQKLNRERNVDITQMPAMGAYNSMAQSQFNGDLARYKGDWATKSTATNALQLDKEWRKESQRLTQMYADVAKQRIEYIQKNDSTAAAVKQGYKLFPVPRYDAESEQWINKKPLTSYER